MRTLFFLFVSSLVHFLAARWLLSTFSANVVPKRRRLVYVIAGVLSVMLGGMRFLSSFVQGEPVRSMVAIATLELGTVMIALLPIGLMWLVVNVAAMLASTLRRRGAKDDEPHHLPEPAPDVVTRRQVIERAAGFGLLATTTSLLGWGMVRGRHAFALEEVVVRVKGWPRALEGYVIAQVSDVHVGTFVRDRELDEGFELVKKIRPDLVVATGDLVDFESKDVGMLALRLLASGARDGAYAILGNHDHYAGAADVAAGLKAAGVRVLNNESLVVRGGDGGGFALVGVDDMQGRLRRGAPPDDSFNGPDLGAALRGLDPDLPRILLAHQPRFLREASGRVALQLSGHTHGGQINPGFRPAELMMDYVAGRYEREGTTLWVNRGFGVAGPPSRVGAPPEVTKIVLVSA